MFKGRERKESILRKVGWKLVLCKRNLRKSQWDCGIRT